MAAAAGGGPAAQAGPARQADGGGRPRLISGDAATRADRAFQAARVLRQPIGCAPSPNMPQKRARTARQRLGEGGPVG
jgi:hypothetical protein